MSDMQTALTKALEEGKRKFLTSTVQAWDDHEQQIRQPQQEKAVSFVKTGNMSKDTFDFIKANQYLYRQAAAAKAIADLGYKNASVHAVITQMKRNGMVKMNIDGELFVTQDQYKPFANPYKTNPVNKKKTAPKKDKQPSAGIAALKPDAAAAWTATETLVQSKWDAETVLANINVKEAFKLYEALWPMFGGK